MGRYGARREVDETITQLHKIGELFDAWKGLTDVAVATSSLWLDGGDPYPRDPDWTVQTRQEQANSIIAWLEDEIRKEEDGI
jgi:hypothetical protein